jgi:phage shock protein C
MFCSKCGNQLPSGARFCSSCGASYAPEYPGVYPQTGQLTRPRNGRMIAGICAGLALHYGWDLSLVRVLAALLIVLTGVGIIAYLVAWVVIPEAPYELPLKTS